MSEQPQADTIIIAGFSRIRLIGKGGFSRVYSAVSDASKIEYAVKVYDFASISSLEQSSGLPDLQEMIHNEVHMFFDCKLSHPNILAPVKCFRTMTKAFIVMPLCRNGSLGELLVRRKAPLDINQIRFIGHQCVAGLLHLHSRNVLHRDIKLENIFIEEGRVMLGDFGLSAMHQAICSGFIGTTEFIPPEISRDSNKNIYNNKCDVWSLGVCLYILAFGTDPWNQQNYLYSFDDLERISMTQQIRSRAECSGANLHFPPDNPNSHYPLFRSLLAQMVMVAPADRCDMQQVDRHPFFQSDSELQARAGRSHSFFSDSDRLDSSQPPQLDLSAQLKLNVQRKEYLAEHGHLLVRSLNTLHQLVETAAANDEVPVFLKMQLPLIEYCLSQLGLKELQSIVCECEFYVSSQAGGAGISEAQRLDLGEASRCIEQRAVDLQLSLKKASIFSKHIEDRFIRLSDCPADQLLALHPNLKPLAVDLVKQLFCNLLSFVASPLCFSPQHRWLEDFYEAANKMMVLLSFEASMTYPNHLSLLKYSEIAAADARKKIEGFLRDNV